MLICELCKRAFAAAWSASQRLCRACEVAYRQHQEQQQRQRDWMQVQFEQRAALRTAAFKVRVGKFTDWPGSISSRDRLCRGDAGYQLRKILREAFYEFAAYDEAFDEAFGDADGGSELA